MTITKKINGLYGGTVPAKIWKDVMTVATKEYGSKDFDYPEIELKIIVQIQEL